MKMGTSQQFSLRWNNYIQHITCAFDNLRSEEDFVDVTLSCEGRKIHAHRMLLSACSSYFKDVFKENPCKHPVIIFRNVRFEDLVAIVDFMYQGEVNIEQEQLSSFLTTAEMLAVQGLTDGTGSGKEKYPEEGQRRHSSLLESSLTGSNMGQEVTNNIKQNTPKSTNKQSNIPHSSSNVSFYNQQINRTETPPGKKRKYNNFIKNSNSTNQDTVVDNVNVKSMRKLFVKNDRELVLPKVEVNEFGEDNDSCFSAEQDTSASAVDVNNQFIDNKSQDNGCTDVFSPNSRESPHTTHIKLEESTSPDLEKSNATAAAVTLISEAAVAASASVQPGPSAGVDSLQDQAMVEEYLEEEFDEEELEVEEVEEEEQQEHDTNFEIYELAGGRAIEFLDEDGSVTMEENDNYPSSYIEYKPSLETYYTVKDFKGVEYIYGEGISENNEIIIGQIPKFQCKECDATFKRIDSLYKHNSVHKGKTKCTVCQAVFSRVAHLTRHMKTQHATSAGANDGNMFV